MPRKQRISFPGAKYHITTRGIRKTTLFFDEEDYEKYLTFLEKTMTSHPFCLHTYCIMTNHIHLQLETIEIPIYTIMKQLNTGYAKYFNKKYGYSGHVFESRYGAELIDSTEYELDVSKYIHMNPVKARIVEYPEDYRWSSYRFFLFQLNSALLKTTDILSYFPDPKQSNYQQFMNEPFKSSRKNEALYKDFYREIRK